MASEPVSASGVNSITKLPASPFGSINTLALHLGGLLLIGLFLFWPVLRNGFVFGDVAAIANNDLLRDRQFVPSLFTNNGAPDAIYNGYYAPVAAISYALDYQWHTNIATGALSSPGVHATTLFLYLATCIAAYLLLVLLTNRPRLAAVGALFFLVHPMHAENVNYVASRGETLGALFLLVMLLVAWWRPKAVWAYFPYVLLLFAGALLAMLSAPVGLCAPLLLLLVDWQRRRGDSPHAIGDLWPLRYGAVLAALVIWVILNAALGTLAPQQPVYAAFMGAQKMLLPFRALLRYLTITVFPHPQTVIYDPLEQGAQALSNVGLIVLLLFVVLAVVVAAMTKRVKYLLFGVLWLLLALLPSLVYLPTHQLVTESRLLLPSLGVCLIAAAIVYALGQATVGLLDNSRNMALASATAIVLALLASMSYTRGRDWKKAEVFWQRELQLHPRQEQVLASVGFYQAQEKDFKAAAQSYAKARAHYKTRPIVFYELAMAQQAVGNDAASSQTLEQAMNLKGIKDGSFYSAIGLAYERMGSWDRARAAYNRGLELDPKNWQLHFNIGNVLMLQKQYAAAVREYDEALQGAPSISQGAIYVNRSMAKRLAGDLQGAIADAEKLRQVDPFEPRAYMLAASAKLALAGRTTDEKKRFELVKEAVQTLEKGDDNLPTPSRDLLLMLSNLDYMLDYPEPALANARKVVDQINPGDINGQVFLGSLLISQNLYKELGQRYKALLENYPEAGNDPRILANLGYAFMQLGDTDTARNLCERSLKLANRNPMGLLLYRRLVERNVPVNVEVGALPPAIFPGGKVPEPGEMIDLQSEEPMTLNAREPLAP